MNSPHSFLKRSIHRSFLSRQDGTNPNGAAADQGAGNGAGNGAGGAAGGSAGGGSATGGSVAPPGPSGSHSVTPSSSVHPTPSSVRTTPSSTARPPSSSARPTSSSASPTPSTKPTSTSQPTSSSTPASASSTAPSSSGSASSTTGTTSSTGTASIVTTPAATLAAANTGLPIASSFRPVSQTNTDSAGSTITADPADATGGSSAISAGPIAGGVIGGLIALGALGFIIATFLRRRSRQRRRRARQQQHESDFGTFNRSAFVKPQAPTAMDEPDVVPDMAEAKDEHVSSGYGATGAAIPPSQLAAAVSGAAAPAKVQERPKYVFGQPPEAGTGSGSDDNHNTAQQQHGDNSEAYAGAYSTDAQAQAAYNAEAYGAYAQYADAAGGAGYQEAERGYQAQQGYDQQQEYVQQQPQGYYDQSGAWVTYEQSSSSAYYEQHQQHYEYSQSYDQYGAQPGQAVAYQPAEATGYQPPHPYAHSGATRGDAAYGGM